MGTGRQDKATPFDPESLRQDWSEIIDSLSLSEPRRRFLRTRWLEYVLWMEKASQRTRKRYYVLRSIVAAGAVILPALVGLNVIGSAKTAVLWITFAISIVVGLAAALEGFFRLGERWRHYRKRVEELKAEGWRFYQLSGEYQVHADHDGAFPQFVANVELILANEVDEFIAEIARAPEPQSTAPSAAGDQGG